MRAHLTIEFFYFYKSWIITPKYVVRFLLVFRRLRSLQGTSSCPDLLPNDSPHFGPSGLILNSRKHPRLFWFDVYMHIINFVINNLLYVHIILHKLIFLDFLKLYHHLPSYCICCNFFKDLFGFLHCRFWSVLFPLYYMHATICRDEHWFRVSKPSHNRYW